MFFAPPCSYVIYWCVRVFVCVKESWKLTNGQLNLWCVHNCVREILQFMQTYWHNADYWASNVANIVCVFGRWWCGFVYHFEISKHFSDSISPQNSQILYFDNYFNNAINNNWSKKEWKFAFWMKHQILLMIKI